jgi:multidrug transporter EmrE-like cation transporter
MNIYDIIWLSITEIFSDFALKQYANKPGATQYLIAGSIGYVGVVYFLIQALRNSTILMVNGAWDGISTILESVAAFIILGERFEHNSQYVGLLLIVLGLFLLKIPMK